MNIGFVVSSLFVLICTCNSMPFDSITGNFKRCDFGQCTDIKQIFFVKNNCTIRFEQGWHVWFIVNKHKYYGLVNKNFVIEKSLCVFEDEGSIISKEESLSQQGIYGFFNDLYDYCYLTYICVTQAFAGLFFLLRHKIKNIWKPQDCPNHKSDIHSGQQQIANIYQEPQSSQSGMSSNNYRQHIYQPQSFSADEFQPPIPIDSRQLAIDSRQSSLPLQQKHVNHCPTHNTQPQISTLNPEPQTLVSSQHSHIIHQSLATSLPYQPQFSLNLKQQDAHYCPTQNPQQQISTLNPEPQHLVSSQKSHILHQTLATCLPEQPQYILPLQKQHSTQQQHQNQNYVSSQQPPLTLVSIQRIVQPSAPEISSEDTKSCSCHKISIGICKTKTCGCMKNGRKCNTGCHKGMRVYCENPIK